MRTRSPVALPLVLALVLAAPPGAEAGCPDADLAPAELTPDRAKAAVQCAINRVRRHHGLRKLRANGRLENAARRHSQAMDKGNFFSHYSRSGADLVDRIARTGYMSGSRRWGVGENLRWGSGGQGTPNMAVRAWMASPAHRRTLLSRPYRHIGVGVALGSPLGVFEPSSAIYTADFGYH